MLQQASDGRLERLGGSGTRVAAELEQLTGKKTRSVVLGHLQHGGTPTAFDRVLATRFGGKAMELVHHGTFGMMVANRPPELVAGMSRALLKLSGSLVHDYATISDDSPSPNRASRARRAATSAGIS